MVFRSVGQPDGFQSAERELALRPAWKMPMDVQHRQFDVLERRSPGEQIEALKNKTNLLVPNVGQFVAVELGDVGAVEPVATLGGPIQAADDVHQSGFARTAGAHDGDKLAAPHFECYAAHRVHVHFTGVIDFVDVFELNNWAHAQGAFKIHAFLALAPCFSWVNERHRSTSTVFNGFPSFSARLRPLMNSPWAHAGADCSVAVMRRMMN